MIERNLEVALSRVGRIVDDDHPVTLTFVMPEESDIPFPGRIVPPCGPGREHCPLALTEDRMADASKKHEQTEKNVNDPLMNLIAV